MKKIRILCSLVFVSLLVSCGTTRESTSEKVNQNRGRNNVEASTHSSQSASSARTASSEAAATASANKKAAADNQASFKRMYGDLKMTDDQISRFEREWKTSMDSWSRNNRNKTMNDYERIENQDRILKDILNDSQFESYQEWVRKQADRR